MYEVYLTKTAEQELEDQYRWWADNRSPEQASKWYSGFIAAILSLEQNPERNALALENTNFTSQIFQLNFGIGKRPTHRALYTIGKKRVTILRVRHLRQYPLGSEST